MPKHERHEIVAGGDLDLRNVAFRIERFNQRADLGDARADCRMQHVAGIDIGHVAAVALAETDEHPALFFDELHAEPALAPVSPRRVGQCRQHFARTHFADAFEIFQQHALLRGDLRGGRQMLQRAAAADAEMRAAWQHAIRRGAEHFLDRCLIVMPVFPGETHAHALAGQCAAHENGLAVDVRHAAAIVREAGDVGFKRSHPRMIPAADIDAALTPRDARVMLRILVADDDAISLHFLRSALEQLGCATVGASSLTEALAAAAENSFDLLLLDRNMPGGGGMDLLAALRERGVVAPAVATSAEITDSTRARLHAAGFAACIEKPVTLARLGEILRPWLRDVDISPLDDAAGLAAIGGDQQALRALRTMLASELVMLRDDVEQNTIAPDVLLDRLHRLRASCGFCGAPKLAGAAAAFEQALRANAPDTSDQRGNFIVLATETIDALRT